MGIFKAVGCLQKVFCHESINCTRCRNGRSLCLYQRPQFKKTHYQSNKVTFFVSILPPVNTTPSSLLIHYDPSNIVVEAEASCGVPGNSPLLNASAGLPKTFFATSVFMRVMEETSKMQETLSGKSLSCSDQIIKTELQMVYLEELVSSSFQEFCSQKCPQEKAVKEQFFSFRCF